LRRSDDTIAEKALEWTPHGCRGRRQASNSWERDLKMWTAGFRFSWRKPGAAELWSVASAALAMMKHNLSQFSHFCSLNMMNGRYTGSTVGTLIRPFDSVVLFACTNKWYPDGQTSLLPA